MEQLNVDTARDAIGARVLYRPAGGGPPEFGTLVRVGPGWNGHAFVLYDGDQGAKATTPTDLYLDRR